MSDFTDAKFGAITPDLLLRSLLSGITAQPTGACGIRVQGVDTSQKTLSRVPVCATAYELLDLVRRSLIMAYDGKVAIRTTTLNSLDGAGLENCVACASASSEYDLLSSIFVQDENGVVYMNIVNLTT